MIKVSEHCKYQKLFYLEYLDCETVDSRTKFQDLVMKTNLN